MILGQKFKVPAMQPGLNPPRLTLRETFSSRIVFVASKPVLFLISPLLGSDDCSCVMGARYQAMLLRESFALGTIVAKCHTDLKINLLVTY